MTSITGQNKSLSLAGPAAFTLLELVLVLALMSVAVALAVPVLHGFAKGRRTVNYLDQLVSLTHYARTQSITRGLPYRLNVDPSTRSCWLTVQQDDGTFAPPGNDFGQTFSPPDGVNISLDAEPKQDGRYVQFLPTGRAEQATILVTGPDGRVTQIACLSPTEMFHVVTNSEPQ